MGDLGQDLCLASSQLCSSGKFYWLTKYRNQPHNWGLSSSVRVTLSNPIQFIISTDHYHHPRMWILWFLILCIFWIPLSPDYIKQAPVATYYSSDDQLWRGPAWVTLGTGAGSWQSRFLFPRQLTVWHLQLQFIKCQFSLSGLGFYMTWSVSIDGNQATKTTNTIYYAVSP